MNIQQCCTVQEQTPPPLSPLPFPLNKSSLHHNPCTASGQTWKHSNSSTYSTCLHFAVTVILCHDLDKWSLPPPPPPSPQAGAETMSFGGVVLLPHTACCSKHLSGLHLSHCDIAAGGLLPIAEICSVDELPLLPALCSVAIRVPEANAAAEVLRQMQALARCSRKLHLQVTGCQNS